MVQDLKQGSFGHALKSTCIPGFSSTVAIFPRAGIRSYADAKMPCFIFAASHQQSATPDLTTVWQGGSRCACQAKDQSEIRPICLGKVAEDYPCPSSLVAG